MGGEEGGGAEMWSQERGLSIGNKGQGRLKESDEASDERTKFRSKPFLHTDVEKLLYTKT